MRSLKLLLCCLLAGVVLRLPAYAEDKSVTISWQPFEDSIEYEFELSANAKLEPLLVQEKYSATQVSLQLKPGTYYFRVRGIGKSGSHGVWSETESLLVLPQMLTPIEPEDQHVFREKLPDGAVHFKWSGGSEHTKYLLELQDQNGKVLRHPAEGTEHAWGPLAPGQYQWRTGYQTPSGDKWGEYRRFTIESGAVPDYQVTLSPEDESASPERPPEWWVIGRLAQSVVVYNSDDKDTNLVSTSAALVGVMSAELRWRDGKKAGQNWLFSGSLNFEMIRQLVLDASFNLPRFYGRVFYTKEAGLWRGGPFLQLHTGKSGFFEVQDQTTIRSDTITRHGIGLGGVAVYRTSANMMLSALALVRMDMGGDSKTLPNPLSSSLSLEAGFGTVLNLSQKMMLEGRLRVLQESFSWKSLNAGAGNSSLSNLFLILDAGVGFRL